MQQSGPRHRPSPVAPARGAVSATLSAAPPGPALGGVPGCPDVSLWPLPQYGGGTVGAPRRDAAETSGKIE
jgi:hypothetical protein